METKKTIFIESESDIENIDEIDYPFIYVIIDTSHQIVLFELKPSVFSSLNVSKDKLKICFEKIFSLYGFEVLFEEKYSLQGTTQGNGLTGGVPPVRFSM